MAMQNIYPEDNIETKEENSQITFVENSSTFQVLYEETKLCVLETGQVVVVR